jgi:hypothetical protein
MMTRRRWRGAELLAMITDRFSGETGHRSRRASAVVGADDAASIIHGCGPTVSHSFRRQALGYSRRVPVVQGAETMYADERCVRRRYPGMVSN